MMLRKIVALGLVIVMGMFSFPIQIDAKESDELYTDAQKEQIYSNYMSNEDMFEALFCDNKAVGYLSMTEKIESNSAISWAIDVSSKILGEDLDKKDYAEILANLVAMQEGDFAEQVEQQGQFDDVKNLGDYTKDITDIAMGAVNSTKVMEEISPIIDAATGGKEVIVESIEQAEYYQISLQSYTQTEYFLRAISQYAEIEGLRSAAKDLLYANEKLLEKRLEYVTDSAENLGNYEADFFVSHLSVALLKSTDIYQADETVKWFVDCGENLMSSVSSVIKTGELAFRATMLAGDIGFGTSNMFNRYQEMKVVADVANALMHAIHKIQISDDYQDVDAIDNIQEKCKYYKALLTTHARGEYLVYQLLMNDAGVMSALRRFSESFLEPQETTEGWYNGQIKVLGEYLERLYSIFSVEGMELVEDKPTDDSLIDDAQEETEESKIYQLDEEGVAYATRCFLAEKNFRTINPELEHKAGESTEVFRYNEVFWVPIYEAEAENPSYYALISSAAFENPGQASVYTADIYSLVEGTGKMTDFVAIEEFDAVLYIS